MIRVLAAVTTLVVLVACSNSAQVKTQRTPPPTASPSHEEIEPSATPETTSPQTIESEPTPKPTAKPTKDPLEEVDPPETVPGPQSVEYKLAVIDGAAVSPEDPIVRKYGDALDKLEPKCKNPRERLGDMAVVAQELLANGGQQESLLSILVSVYRSIPKGFPVTDCADIFSGYVVLRGGEA